MSATILLHGPFTFHGLLIKSNSEADFANIDIAVPGAKVTLIAPSRADCDALIEAALAARGLLPEPPGHPFARPGQVAPDRPAADRCMVCARPENEHPAPELAPDPAVPGDASNGAS